MGPSPRVWNPWILKSMSPNSADIMGPPVFFVLPQNCLIEVAVSFLGHFTEKGKLGYKCFK